MRGWRWVTGFFRFSRREIDGIKVLFFVIALALFFPIAFRMFAPRAESIPGPLRDEIRHFLASREAAVVDGADYSGTVPDVPDRTKSGINAVTYFKFDPNDLDRDGWLSLGFSEKQITMILNYRNKGGRFYRREDLRKIYAIGEEDYLRIADYVHIPGHGNGKDQLAGFASKPVPKDLLIELNGADSLQLQLLPGIGPAFASRIVRFRERLGGFYDLSQLMDVYGMDEARLQGFAGYIELDLSLLRPVRINESDQETLGRHPLIGFKLAGILVRYRGHHGPFRDADDLRETGVVDEEVLQKLRPYLLF